MSMTLVKEYAYKLLDAAPDAMIIADSCGSIIHASHHAATLFGYLSVELIGEQARHDISHYIS
jgi:PAS domain S-box-containing protein